MDRPLIAINGEQEGEDTPKTTLQLRYAEAVERAGGIPLVLTSATPPATFAHLFERVDGLLLSGGGDFDTERLGLEPVHPAAKPVPAAKQDFDFALVRAALGIGLPILGVCYGMQLLALAERGRLHQHLPDDVPGALEHRGGVRHAVRVDAGTKLAELVGVDVLEVVSRHHQALSDPGPSWTVCARDDDGLIEAIERVDLRFAVAVQWHPELSPGSPHDGLFAGLVVAAREHQGAGVVS